MAPLLIFSATLAVFGFYLGWRRRSTWPRLVAQAFGFTFLFLIGLLAGFSEHPQGFSFKYLLSSLQYWIFLYPIFFLLPCVLGEAVGKGMRKRRQKERDE
jgi:hypothetical protein